jgi:hypothetical protein
VPPTSAGTTSTRREGIRRPVLVGNTHRTTAASVCHAKRGNLQPRSMGRTAWPAPPSAEATSSGKIQQRAACPRLQLVLVVHWAFPAPFRRTGTPRCPDRRGAPSGTTSLTCSNHAPQERLDGSAPDRRAATGVPLDQQDGVRHGAPFPRNPDLIAGPPGGSYRRPRTCRARSRCLWGPPLSIRNSTGWRWRPRGRLDPRCTPRSPDAGPPGARGGRSRHGRRRDRWPRRRRRRCA